MGTSHAVSIREGDGGMPQGEMWDEAAATIDAIDRETGVSQARKQRVQQLFNVGLMINRAKSMGARFHTAHRIVQFCFKVFVSNYGLGMAR